MCWAEVGREGRGGGEVRQACVEWKNERANRVCNQDSLTGGPECPQLAAKQRLLSDGGRKIITLYLLSLYIHYRDFII